VKIKTTLAAMVLVALPGMAMAMGCNTMRATTASACGEGQVWDTGSQTCIIPTTS
jgi:hypothetical protein